MQEIKKVLTPIDFSDNAEKIASAAAYIAGTFKAELHLIFVAQNFEDYSGFFVPPVNLPNLEAELFESAKQRMVTFTEENKSTFENYEVQELPVKSSLATWLKKSLTMRKKMISISLSWGHMATRDLSVLCLVVWQTKS